MKITRTLFWVGLMATIIMGFASIRMAYAADDASFNFTQLKPEYVTGFKVKTGPTAGGPYPDVTNCVKPAPGADGTFTCVAPVPYSPLYGVVTNHNGEGVESPPSNEAKFTITAPPPDNLKIVVIIRTVSSFTLRGNIVAKTTVTTKEVPADAVVNTKPIAYWNSATKQYISQTTLVM